MDKITSDGGQQKFLAELHRRVVPPPDPDMPVSSKVSLKDLEHHIDEVSKQMAQDSQQQEPHKKQPVQLAQQEEREEYSSDGMHP